MENTQPNPIEKHTHDLQVKIELTSKWRESLRLKISPVRRT